MVLQASFTLNKPRTHKEYFLHKVCCLQSEHNAFSLLYPIKSLPSNSSSNLHKSEYMGLPADINNTFCILHRWVEHTDIVWYILISRAYWYMYDLWSTLAYLRWPVGCAIYLHRSAECVGSVGYACLPIQTRIFFLPADTSGMYISLPKIRFSWRELLVHYLSPTINGLWRSILYYFNFQLCP